MNNEEKYEISNEGQEYLSERIANSKKEISMSIVFSIALPLGFVALKSNFFEKVNFPLIITAIIMCAFIAIAMVNRLIKKTKAMKSIVKEVHFQDENRLEITLFYNNITFLINKDDLILYEGYKGPKKMKNIFDEPTYRLENWKEGLVFYLISSYFQDWGKLAGKFESIQN